MMRLRSFILFSFIPFFFFTAALQSQDTNIVKYLPLQVGNVWVYTCSATGQSCYCIKKMKYEIAESIIINNRLYYVFYLSQYNIECFQSSCDAFQRMPMDTLRIDSLNGRVFKYKETGYCANTPNEMLFDSLKANLDDTVMIYCGNSNYPYRCVDTSVQYSFGSTRNSKLFQCTEFETGFSRRYVKGIGIYEIGYGSILCGSSAVLNGCVINGIVYGDTSTIVGIKQISSEVPESFSLSQNYPNPFNPITKIRFALPPSPSGEGLGVRLTVYDILGREVATLVNEQLSPGTYEVDWDGNNYASGVYFYTMTSGRYTESKKMVIIK